MSTNILYHCFSVKHYEYVTTKFEKAELYV